MTPTNENSSATSTPPAQHQNTIDATIIASFSSLDENQAPLPRAVKRPRIEDEEHGASALQSNAEKYRIQQLQETIVRHEEALALYEEDEHQHATMRACLGAQIERRDKTIESKDRENAALRSKFEHASREADLASSRADLAEQMLADAATARVEAVAAVDAVVHRAHSAEDKLCDMRFAVAAGAAATRWADSMQAELTKLIARCAAAEAATGEAAATTATATLRAQQVNLVRALPVEVWVARDLPSLEQLTF